MEYITVGNAAIVLIALVVLAIVIPASISDILLNRRGIRNLIIAGKRTSTQPITVVIVLRKRFASIVPLLDHLYGFSYRKLRILIISHHLAGRNVRRDAERYVNSFGRKNLEIVAHKKGQTLDQEVDRYVKTDIWIKLDESLSLAKRFFELVSYDYRGVSMIPMVQSDITNRLTSLFRAYDAALTNRSTDLRMQHSPALIHSKKNEQVFEPTRAAIIMSNQQTLRSYAVHRIIHFTDMLAEWSGIIFLCTAGLTIGSIIYFGDSSNFPILGVAAAILYAVGLYSLQARSIYGKHHRVSLVLVLPFKVVLDFVLLVISIIVLPGRVVWRLKHRSNYKHQRNNR